MKEEHNELIVNLKNTFERKNEELIVKEKEVSSLVDMYNEKIKNSNEEIEVYQNLHKNLTNEIFSC